MTRSTSLHFPEGTTRIGTARVREDCGPVKPAAQRPAVESKASKTPKYRNSRCEHDGVWFDSLKERSRWLELREMQAAGAIHGLALQVPFVLVERRRRDDGSWEKASKYVADFAYTDAATGNQVVEDVKSPITRKNATYVLKRKLMLARHDITIKEI